MTTVIVPPIHHEDPDCPYCHRSLPGWSEPPDFAAKHVIAGIALVVLLMIGLLGTLFGASDGSYDYCEKPFSKRYHYIVPTYPASCAATRWLLNKQVYRNKE